MWTDDLNDLVSWLAADDVSLRGLREIAALRPLLDDLELELLAEARARRWTWTMIGAAMGVSRHAARRRAGMR